MVTNAKQGTKKRQAYSYRPFEPDPFTAQSAERATHIAWYNIPTLSCTKSVSVYFCKFLRTKSDLRTAPFWVITQRVVVISYRSFGTAYRSHLQGSRIQKQSVAGDKRRGHHVTKWLDVSMGLLCTLQCTVGIVCGRG